MSQRLYEFRVLGRLSDHTLHAFANMDVTEVPAQTVICARNAYDGEVNTTLALIESLGLRLLSIEQVM
jgi:hypothetical protein